MRLGLESQVTTLDGTLNGGFGPALNLPDSRMSTDYVNVKTLTVLKANTPENPLLPKAGKEIDIKENLTIGSHCKVESKNLEGIYYSVSPYIDDAQSSAANYYQFTDDVTVKLL